MRIVVQRVSKASVTSNGELVGSIERGLCLLIGISRDDTIPDAESLVRKVLKLRLWSEGEGEREWQRTVQDIQGGILAISQFTLYGRTDKGAKPDFHAAMKTEEAREMFEKIVQMFRNSYPSGCIETGSFGQLMQVEIQNDGPVTLILESK
jgi:D-tyrosyl-tRNA(Tyr) deacylase